MVNILITIKVLLIFPITLLVLCCSVMIEGKDGALKGGAGSGAARINLKFGNQNKFRCEYHQSPRRARYYFSFLIWCCYTYKYEYTFMDTLDPNEDV